MQYLKTITASACMMLWLIACKNDRGNDNHMDTSTVSSTPNPYNAAPTPVTDSMTKPADDKAVEKNAAPATTVAPPAEKRAGETVSTTRTRKTSRKGRIILASLNTQASDRMEADREGVYNRAEIMPAYPGGEKELRKFIERNIVYPEAALDNEVQGTVKISFAVDEQGRIYNPGVISPRLGNGLEDEALRVVRQMPKWTPGQIKGKNVKTRFTLPITYQISDL
ncbi:energy transducer TonB [Sediminibacterium soli]|uniref:energy transducer TonB n=1 Tax=Sediminibacterium soli TaxID=2698829 RepID=UPI001379EC06|nr:energy transducer TonB [Sediminibacterium soli]NCI45871.1 TonB family protein [Sediminibacterium soli]